LIILNNHAENTWLVDDMRPSCGFCQCLN